MTSSHLSPLSRPPPIGSYPRSGYPKLGLQLRYNTPDSDRWSSMPCSHTVPTISTVSIVSTVSTVSIVSTVSAWSLQYPICRMGALLSVFLSLFGGTPSAVEARECVDTVSTVSTVHTVPTYLPYIRNLTNLPYYTHRILEIPYILCISRVQDLHDSLRSHDNSLTNSRAYFGVNDDLASCLYSYSFHHSQEHRQVIYFPPPPSQSHFRSVSHRSRRIGIDEMHARVSLVIDSRVAVQN